MEVDGYAGIGVYSSWNLGTYYTNIAEEIGLFLIIILQELDYFLDNVQKIGHFSWFQSSRRRSNQSPWTDNETGKNG